MNPALGDHLVAEKTDKMMREYWQTHLADSQASKASHCHFFSSKVFLVDLTISILLLIARGFGR